MSQPENGKMDIDGLSAHPITKPKFDSNSLMMTSQATKKKLSDEGERRDSEMRKFSSLERTIFCEQLEDFVSRAQQFRKNVSESQRELQEKLDSDIKNLEFLFIETRETVNHINKLKTQYSFVKKDVVHTKDILKKLKKEEVQEKEKEISRCDETLYKLWETVKRSVRADTVEKFLAELQEKSTALELLKELANQKLNEINQVGSPLMIQFNTPLRAREKSVRSLTYEPRKLPRPIRYTKKRKFPERNEVYLTIQDSMTSLTPQQSTVLQIMSHPLSLTMDRDSAVSYSSSQATEKTSSTQSLNMAHESRNYNRTELTTQDNMQSVLQALFGDAGQISNNQEQFQDAQLTDNADSLVGFDLFKQDSTFLF